MRVLIILILVSLPLMAQENLGVGVDGRLQTSRITSSGSGSGGKGYQPKWWDLSIGPAADSLDYDFEIIDLSDSTEFTNSLNIAVDSLSALAVADAYGTSTLFIAPGEYLVCDTVWGPPTVDSFHKLIISGPPGNRDATVLHFARNDNVTSYMNAGKFRGEEARGKVWRNTEFSNMRFYCSDDYYGTVWAIDTLTACNKDSVVIRNCYFDNWYQASGTSYATDLISDLVGYGNASALWAWPSNGNGWQFIDCHFHNLGQISSYFRTMDFIRCEWTGILWHGLKMIYDGVGLPSLSNYTTQINVKDCHFRHKPGHSGYATATGISDDNQQINWINTIFENTSNAYYGMAGICHTGGRMTFTGCSFLGRGGAETFTVSTQASSTVIYRACYFERLVVYARDNGGIFNCTLNDSAYVQITSADATGNSFIGYATYGVDVAGTGCVVGGNTQSQGARGTFINDGGTATILYNNH